MLKKSVILFSINHQKKYSTPLRLLIFDINGLTVECEYSIKFLGVRIDESITQRNHIPLNKIAKNIELLYRGGYNSTLPINAYLNYANIAGAITHKTKLKKVQIKQKHAIIFNQPKIPPSEPLFLALNVLNVY